MRYDDKYDKTEERMLDVIDTVQELSKDRFLASLYIRHCSPLDVDIRLAEVRRCLSIVNGESLRLAKLELTYNKDFAVLDNQRFTTAEKLFNQLRSSMAYIRKSFRQSCPIIRKLPRNPNFRPSVFERSVLTKGCCARELFDITCFDDNVQALYYEQQALYANIILSLSICYRVIKEEKETKEDANLCVQLLEEQCRRIIEDMGSALRFTTDIPESHIQQMINEMGLHEYARTHFHNESIENLTQHAIYLSQQNERDDQSTQFDSLFLNPQQLQDAKLLAQHLDEVMPSNREKMDALKIRLYCNWCKGGKHDNPQQTYYSLLLKNYHGSQGQYPEWHAVTTSKNRKNLDLMTEQAKFNKEADALIAKYKSKKLKEAE